MSTNSTTISATATNLNTATKVLETAREIAAHPADLNAKEAYRRLSAVYSLGADFADDFGMEWPFVMGKTQQWKTVAPWAERVIATLEAIVATLTERHEAEVAERAAQAGAAQAAQEATETEVATEAAAEKSPRKGQPRAEENPLTHELLAMAATAGGLDFAAEARLRGMTYDAVNAPVRHFSQRSGTTLLMVKMPGARGKTYFTQEAWDAHHARYFPEVTPVAWPKKR
jgi:hypothetical protein